MNVKINTVSASVYETLKIKNIPVSLTWLAQNLLYPKKEIKAALLELLAEKKIVRVRGKNFALAGQTRSAKLPKGFVLLKGRIISHPDGYAFFVPETGEKDLFIPPSKLLGAVDGDIVLVRRVRSKGRIEGHVTEIVERKLIAVVGRVENHRGQYIVIPLSRKFTVPLTIRSEDIYQEDDIVVCRITQFPFPGRQAAGEVVKRLGNLADKGIENTIVIHKYELSRKFPDGTEAEAEAVSHRMPAKGENKGRSDLRSVFTVTIDGENARDFDDAISIEKDADGYTLYVHIADVAHYVRFAGEIDKEAFSRGTSVYFPEFAIPMLPDVLSSGVCSLKPREDRFSISIKIRYTPDGVKKESTLYQSLIRSDHRLTYAYANQILAGEESANTAVKDLLSVSHELMQLLREHKKTRGMIDFALPEVEFIFDAEGNMSNITLEKRGISERIIEHFMIEANEAVAQTLSEVAPHSIYRNHARPDLLKLQQWAEIAENFGYSIGDVPDEITPKIVQRWFADIENKRYSYLLKSLLVRSMQRAEYSVENTGHFGLAAEFYTHFTSPIRRYPDLVVHRLLKCYYFKNGEPMDAGYLAMAASQSSVTERKAEDAEREIYLYKKLAYLRDNPGHEHPAFISKITANGFVVFLTELLLSGFADMIVSKPRGYQSAVMAGLVNTRSGTKRFFMGDEVTVTWNHTDMDLLEPHFSISTVSDVEIFRPKTEKKLKKRAGSSKYRKMIPRKKNGKRR